MDPLPLVARLRGTALGLALCGAALSLNGCQLLALLALKPVAPRLVAHLNARIAGLVWRLLQHVFERIDGARVTVSGDDIPVGESALVMANHVASADFFLLNAVAIRRRMLHNVRYFIKASLRFLPVFGWGMWMAGMVFLHRQWARDEAVIRGAIARMVRDRTPAWLVVYLEGTRATPEKLSANRSSRGKYTHVLPPRTRGFIATVQQLRAVAEPQCPIRHVYDFTLAYHDALRGFAHAPSVFQVLAAGRALGSRFKFHVHAQRFALDELPESSEALRDWVHWRWAEKDIFLADLERRWSSGG